MRKQTEAAVREADAALFMIDAREGLTPMDEEIARWLRVSTTPVIVVANKAEGRAGESGALEAYRLGLGEPIALSAEHGEGVADLFEALLPHVEHEHFEAGDEEARGRARRSAWRSSAGPTRASPPWSTGCSARSA